MAATREDVIEYLKGMTLLEASELVKELETTFGVRRRRQPSRRLRQPGRVAAKQRAG